MAKRGGFGEPVAMDWRGWNGGDGVGSRTGGEVERLDGGGIDGVRAGGGCGTGVLVKEQCPETNDLFREPVSFGRERLGTVTGWKNCGDGGVLGSGQQVHDLDLQIGRSDSDNCRGDRRSI